MGISMENKRIDEIITVDTFISDALSLPHRWNIHYHNVGIHFGDSKDINILIYNWEKIWHKIPLNSLSGSSFTLLDVFDCMYKCYIIMDNDEKKLVDWAHLLTIVHRGDMLRSVLTLSIIRKRLWGLYDSDSHFIKSVNRLKLLGIIK